jgi:formate hydrogenlyase subunit 4
MTVFLNVVVIPWGLAQTTAPADVLLAIPCVLLKVLLFILVLVYIESSLAKLRLFRITEFLGAAFVISVVAMITRLSLI